ncbi:MAG: CYTH domain-containing protein [Saccharofermentanales bacterium]
METEIKYRLCSDASVDDILDNSMITAHMMPDSRATRRLKNTYYDTGSRDLDRSKAIYRIREENDGTITATVKISRSVSDGLHQRQEWIVEQENEEPDVVYFLRKAESDGDPDNVLTELLSKIRNETMIEICSVEFERTTVHIGYGDTLIELACDVGLYRARRQEEEFFELELELLEGDVKDLVEFGDELEKVLDIIPENMSKYEKSVELGNRVKNHG